MQNSDTSEITAGIPVQSSRYAQFDLEMYTSITPVRPAWDGFVQQRNVFLSGGYLAGLEACPPGNMTFYYVTVRVGKKVVGVIYMQLEEFLASRSLNYERLENSHLANEQTSAWRSFKEFIASRISFYTLLCGNTLVTGSHGYLLDASIDPDAELNLVHYVLGWTREHAATTGKDVRLTFIKDFFEPRFLELHHTIDCLQYHQFTAQPNMIMHMRAQWKTFDDYLESLQSKYRVRVRRARKKCTGIVKRELDVKEIEAHQDALYTLYLRIANRASFNLFILKPGYMASIKRSLGDQFRVFGYFCKGELVAFYSMMENGDEIEAHFLGYESASNREKQLYLNMLLDMVDLAIRERIDHVIFSRTAMEIKSSVGAEPYNMYFYLQHSSPFRNRYLPKVYNLLDPKVEWTPRSPFK